MELEYHCTLCCRCTIHRHCLSGDTDCSYGWEYALTLFILKFDWQTDIYGYHTTGNFCETVAIGYVYNLAILNFGKFRMRTSHAARQLDIGKFEIWRAKLKSLPKFLVIRYFTHRAYIICIPCCWLTSGHSQYTQISSKRNTSFWAHKTEVCHCK